MISVVPASTLKASPYHSKNESKQRVKEKLEELLKNLNALPISMQESASTLLRQAAQDLQKHLDAYDNSSPCVIQKEISSGLFALGRLSQEICDAFGSAQDRRACWNESRSRFLSSIDPFSRLSEDCPTALGQSARQGADQALSTLTAVKGVVRDYVKTLSTERETSRDRTLLDKVVGPVLQTGCEAVQIAMLVPKVALVAGVTASRNASTLIDRGARRAEEWAENCSVIQAYAAARDTFAFRLQDKYGLHPELVKAALDDTTAIATGTVVGKAAANATIRTVRYFETGNSLLVSRPTLAFNTVGYEPLPPPQALRPLLCVNHTSQAKDSEGAVFSSKSETSITSCREIYSRNSSKGGFTTKVRRIERISAYQNRSPVLLRSPDGHLQVREVCMQDTATIEGITRSWNDRSMALLSCPAQQLTLSQHTISSLKATQGLCDGITMTIEQAKKFPQDPPPYWFIVSNKKGDPLGLMHVHCSPGATLELNYLVTNPNNVFNQTKGSGTLLFRMAETLAVIRGNGTIRADALPNALPFYKANGCTIHAYREKGIIGYSISKTISKS